MNVVRFRRRNPTSQGWRGPEIERLTAACADWLVRGRGASLEFGATERGDPQIYLVGPGPEHECILSISRIGPLYIAEDGKGGVLAERHNLAALAGELAAMLRRRRLALLSHIAIAWIALRAFYEDKVEPAMAEPLEVLSHVAPQLAAFA